MFASLGWGIFSALSGLLVSKFSIYTAFQLYFVLEAFAIIPVCFLRFHARPTLAQVSTCAVFLQIQIHISILLWLTAPSVLSPNCCIPDCCVVCEPVLADNLS